MELRVLQVCLALVGVAIVICVLGFYSGFEMVTVKTLRIYQNGKVVVSSSCVEGPSLESSLTMGAGWFWKDGAGQEHSYYPAKGDSLGLMESRSFYEGCVGVERTVQEYPDWGGSEAMRLIRVFLEDEVRRVVERAICERAGVR